MSIDEWWPKLKPSTREWLIENNGDVLPVDVLSDITDAGGLFSEEAIDWIEAVANGEEPAPA
jgi:hypothetical protein